MYQKTPKFSYFSLYHVKTSEGNVAEPEISDQALFASVWQLLQEKVCVKIVCLHKLRTFNFKLE